uniref:Uncharacterized protein n=1 Tax=Helianthus annuus TaxID=4232 RepID=A0A251S792_HELAN
MVLKSFFLPRNLACLCMKIVNSIIVVGLCRIPKFLDDVQRLGLHERSPRRVMLGNLLARRQTLFLITFSI